MKFSRPLGAFLAAAVFLGAVSCGEGGGISFPLTTTDTGIESAADYFDDASEPVCASCDGDLTDEFEEWEIAVNGATDETVYSVTIDGETFTFDCEADTGCDAAADVQLALIDAINDPLDGSLVATASAGSIIITGAIAGYDFDVTVDDGAASDFGTPDNTADASSSVDNSVLTGLLLFPMFVVTEGVTEFLPDGFYDLLPEDAEIGEEYGPATGSITVPCDNNGSLTLTITGLLRRLFIDADEEEGARADWFPVFTRFQTIFRNCLIEGGVGDFGGLPDNAPAFLLNGTFSAQNEIPLVEFPPEGGPPESLLMLISAEGQGVGSDPIEEDSPATGDPIGVWFEDRSAGGTPIRMDIDAVIAVNAEFGPFAASVKGGGPPGGIAALMDGGVCIGGEVDRNYNGIDFDDRCEEGADPGVFNAVTTNCSLGPVGDPSLWMPLALAMGLAAAIRRREKNR